MVGQATSAEIATRSHQSVAPLYLFACLVLGGSEQGGWPDAILEAVGLGVVGWSMMSGTHRLSRAASQVILLALATSTIILLQDLPLLPNSWANATRAHFEAGYRLAGRTGAFYPLSLAPFHSLEALLRMIAPLAIFCAVVRARAFRTSWLLMSLVIGTISQFALGIVASAAAPTVAYRSLGPIAAVTANPRHAAILLIATLPFIAAIAPASGRQDAERYSGLLLISGCVALLVVGATVLTGSFAAIELVLPVIAASVLIITGSRRLVGKAIAIAGALLAIGAAASLTTGIDLLASTRAVPGQALRSAYSRLDPITACVARWMPFGSGAGSFERAYPLCSNATAQATPALSHETGTYLRTAIELGAPGILLMLLFLIWWIAAVSHSCRRATGSAFGRAASIASGLILVDCIADSPLNVQALSVCLALCIAVLADRRQAHRPLPADFRPTRHLVFE